MPNIVRRSRLRGLICVSVGLMAVAVTVIGLALWALRADAIEDAYIDSGMLATVLAEQTSFAVAAIDLTLGDVRERIRTLDPSNVDEYRSRVGSIEFHVWLKERLSRLPQAELIAIMDENGKPISSTRSWPPTTINVKDREYFRYAESNNDTKTFVSIPVISRSDQTLTIFFSQRVSARDGHMIGAVVVGVTVAYFQHIYNGLSSLNSQVFLFLRNDGTVLVRHPDKQMRIGEKIPANSPWYDAVRAGGGAYHSPGYFDGESRFVAVRPLKNYPLVINVSISEAAALEQWRSRAMTISAGGVAVLIGFAFLLRALFSQFHELARAQNTVLEREARLADKSRELSVANAHLDATLNNMANGICMYDADSRLVVFNSRYLGLYGMSPYVVQSGMTFVDVLRHRSDLGNFSGDPSEFAADVKTQLERGDTLSHLVELTGGRIISVVNHPMAGGGWVAMHEDITERRHTEQQIAHMARHDALTNLANRVLFKERMDQAVKALASTGAGFCVFIFDLDLFKAVNDSLGHPAGDCLLQCVADRLRGAVRVGDTIARLGGDEFAVLQLTGPSPRDDAIALAERVQERISAPYDIDGHQVMIGVSIGIATAPQDGEEPVTLLKNADLALYRAKADGRKTFRFFESAMDDKARRRHLLEVDMRGALGRDEFVLHYQPVIDIQSGAVCGVETLVRWQHPQLGLLGPDEFIPLAEETGMIDPLGDWIMHRACADAVSWPADIKLAINLSPVRFRAKGLVDMVRDTLAQTKLPARQLELEVTESVLLHKTDANIAMLRALKELGISIVLDDFGTGYSSLSYLRMFSFDKIKIDRSFVRELDSSDCSAIVCAVTALARSLSITTTAEGVETEDQLILVRSAGCNYAQGYLFARPCPIDQLDLSPRVVNLAAIKAA